MRIEDIKKDDTVRLIAERAGREVQYTGIAYTDFKADCANPGVSLKMLTGRIYYLTYNKQGLRLTSFRKCSLCNVAQYGYFI